MATNNYVELFDSKFINISGEDSKDFLQGLIHDDHKLNPVIIKNGCLEIDSLKDYELYNRMNSNGNLKKFINFEE